MTTKPSAPTACGLLSPHCDGRCRLPAGHGTEHEASAPGSSGAILYVWTASVAPAAAPTAPSERAMELAREAAVCRCITLAWVEPGKHSGGCDLTSKRIAIAIDSAVGEATERAFAAGQRAMQERAAREAEPGKKHMRGYRLSVRIRTLSIEASAPPPKGEPGPQS